MDTARIKKVTAFEDRGIAHRYFRTEPAVAQVRPVTDLAIANADDIRETIAGHVGEEDRLGGVGKDKLGTFFLVPALRSASCRRKAVLGERFIPRKDCVLRDQDVRMAIPGYVHETNVW